MFGRFSDALFALQHCANWREILGALASGQKSIRVVLKDGTILASSQNPLSIVNEIFFAHVYSPHELTIGEQDIVVDIGANVGVFTVFAASQTRNRVYSLEPLPINCEYIQKNLASNHLDHVTCVSTAVSNTSGTVKLYTTDSVAGNLLFDHNIRGEIDAYVEVPCTTLMAFMDEQHLESIDFLKLDCEGSEGDILTSLPTAYLGRIRKMAMEFHDNVSSLNHDAVRHLLESNGFKTKLAWNGRSPFGYVYAWQEKTR